MRAFRFLPLAAAGVALWYARTVYRLRDPVRVVSAAPGEVLSPADGVVSIVRRVEGGQIEWDRAPRSASDLLGVPALSGWVMGIFIGPLDVHYTYQPVGGQITAALHRAGQGNVPLLSAATLAGVLAGRAPEQLSTHALLHNERLSMTTSADLGEITVTFVAPGSGLRATPYVHGGDSGRAGHKSAFLPEGGLALLFLPVTLTPLVSVGDRVVGTQTVIARG